MGVCVIGCMIVFISERLEGRTFTMYEHLRTLSECGGIAISSFLHGSELRTVS